MLAKNFFIHLSKVFHAFQLNFHDTQNYTRQQITSKSHQLKHQINQLVTKIIQEYDQQLISAKRQLKAQRKQKQALQKIYSKNKVEWSSEKKNLENQIQRCGLKISQLLKELLKKQNSGCHQKNIKLTDQEIQCELQFSEFKEIMEIYEKQNISLSKVIIQLKQILKQKQEEIQAEKILVCQLIEELSIQHNGQIQNLSISSMRHSDSQQYSGSQNQDLKIQYTQERQTESFEQYSQKEDEEDSSTIAGISDTGDLDYELPEWMQFNQSEKDYNGVRVYYQHEQQQDQTWFQIIFNKFCNKFQVENFLM